LIVWNEVQATEATELQGISPERVVAAGAANFDRFFSEVEARQSALRPRDAPKSILYLGSSPNVVPDEPPVFEHWLAAVRTSSDALVRDAEVVIRPHPGAHTWKTWQPRDERVGLRLPEGRHETATFAQLLAGADAVVALNTSAEIEAAIAGRPVLTFRAGAEARGQEGSLHFPYLLAEHGGFVLDAATLEEHVRRLGEVLRSQFDGEAMRRFVERFVRPAGLSQPVAPIVASAVLELVRARAAAVA
jgi:hypothetical protein